MLFKKSFIFGLLFFIRIPSWAVPVFIPGNNNITSLTQIVSIASAPVTVPTMTVTYFFTVQGTSAPAITTFPAPFNTGYVYTVLGSSAAAQHMLESYEPWPGNNSTRWVINNSSNGFSVMEVKGAFSSDSTKLVFAGNGPAGNWFPGYPGALTGGVITASHNPGVFYVSGSSAAIGTDVGSADFPIDFFTDGVRRFSMSGAGLLFALDGSSQTAAAKTVGVYISSTNAPLSGSATIPENDSLPTITQGTEFLSSTFTSRSAVSTLRIEASLPISGANGTVVCGLFRTGNANVIATSFTRLGTNATIILDTDIASTAGSQNLTIRCGNSGAGTLQINSGNASGREYGGSSVATLHVEEVVYP